MTYDFSKATDAGIVTLRDRTQAALNNAPNSENAAEWKSYIDQANAELAARSRKKMITYGALAAAAVFFFTRK